MSGVTVTNGARLGSRREDEMKLGSGPGALMFEGGQHARIRRAPVRAIASFTPPNSHGDRFGQVLNLSPGGCLLRTETSLELGDVIDLSVTLVGARQRITVDLRATVRRIDDESERRGYGVEFKLDERPEREAAQWLYARAMGG